MNPLIKSALTSLLNHAIEAEPAFAGELISFLRIKAAPALENYVLTNIPAVLQSVQAKLAGAPAPVNITVLPAVPVTGPGAQRQPPANATVNQKSDAPAASTDTVVVDAAPQAASPAPVVGSNVVIH